MFSYVESSLASGEKIVHRARLSLWSMLSQILSAALVLPALSLLVNPASVFLESLVGPLLGPYFEFFFRQLISIGFLPPVNILVIPIYCLAIYRLGMIWLEYMTTEVAVTNKRIIVKVGFISRATIEINISKLESIQVLQGFVGRLLNFGSLQISGAGNPQAPIHGIDDPMAFRMATIEAQDMALELAQARMQRPAPAPSVSPD